MGLYYSDKNVCLRICVSYKNQNSLMKHIDASFSPLFVLKKDQHCSLKFEYKRLSCSYLKIKREFSYKDIQKIETIAEGIVIYLNSGLYIPISVGRSEKHNTELYDIVTFLKRRCRSRFVIKNPIAYPEDESDGRYKSDQEANLQISFSLTDAEIKRLLWYDYLFGEKMIVFIVAAIAFLIMCVAFWNVWLLIAAIVIVAFCMVLSKFFLETIDGYMQNHQGRLHLLMYNDLFVVRLRHTDLELEYSSMKKKKPVFGLWRLKCGDFFTLVLPESVVRENPSFFDTFYAKIK